MREKGQSTCLKRHIPHVNYNMVDSTSSILLVENKIYEQASICAKSFLVQDAIKKKAKYLAEQQQVMLVRASNQYSFCCKIHNLVDTFIIDLGF